MKKIIFSLLVAMPLVASAQTTLTPQEQLEQAQKQLEQAQKALETAKANAARAAAEAEAKAKAEAQAKAKADAEASSKAAAIQKQIEELKRQTAEIEEQTAKLDDATKGTSVSDAQSTNAGKPVANPSTEKQRGGKSEIKTRLTPVDDDDDNSEDRDKRYLVAGAVPEVNGRVEWTTTMDVPGKTADEIYSVSKEYLSRLVSDKLQLPGSQIAIDNPAEHNVAATVHEWLVFRNSALSLDRAEIFYLLEISSNNGKAVVTMSRIKYKYSVQGKTETYLAEKWITDKEAVNKKHTRLYPISGKFRRKTIDRKDEIFETLSEALK